MNRMPYMRPVSATRWYFRHPRYLRYMSREVTCVFIGAFAWLLVCAVERLSKGQAAYESFLAALRGPWSALGLLVILAFAVHNATSWFNVTPKAMPVQFGEKFLPASVIVAAHYGVWAAATLGVLLLAGVW
jgi:fumarate reductase subunit C